MAFANFSAELRVLVRHDLQVCFHSTPCSSVSALTDAAEGRAQSFQAVARLLTAFMVSFDIPEFYIFM